MKKDPRKKGKKHDKSIRGSGGAQRNGSPVDLLYQGFSG